MKRLLVALALAGCVVEKPVSADSPPADPPPDRSPGVDAPPAAPPVDAVEPLPEIELGDDSECASPRQARVRLDATDDGRCAVVEHLDADGCAAVRIRTTIRGRVTREVVEVPGDPRWAPQPPAYVDLTPRPRITEVEHDAAGREIGLTIDEGADGTIEVRHSHRWTADGQLLERVMTHGERTSTERWRYDDRGREVWRRAEAEGGVTVTEQTWDAADRLLERRSTRDDQVAWWDRWTYDRAGRLTHHTHVSPDRVEETDFTFDAAGREIERTWTRTDHGRLLILERHTSAWRADGGRVIEYERDDRVDGVIDDRRRTVHDPAGREVLIEDLNPRDRRVTWRREMRWDDQDRMVWWQNSESGVVKLQRSWTFDGDRLVESSEFPHGGQPVTRYQTWTYTGDELVQRVEDDGRLVEIVWQRLDAEGQMVEEIAERDGRIASRRRVTRDATGAATRFEQDEDGDGSFEVTRIEVRDAQGEVAWFSLDTDGDQLPERWHRTVRDAAGREVLDAHLTAPATTPYRMIADFGCTP